MLNDSEETDQTSSSEDNSRHGSVRGWLLRNYERGISPPSGYGAPLLVGALCRYGWLACVPTPRREASRNTAFAAQHTEAAHVAGDGRGVERILEAEQQSADSRITEITEISEHIISEYIAYGTIDFDPIISDSRDREVPVPTKATYAVFRRDTSVVEGVGYRVASGLGQGSMKVIEPVKHKLTDYPSTTLFLVYISVLVTVLFIIEIIK